MAEKRHWKYPERHVASLRSIRSTIPEKKKHLNMLLSLSALFYISLFYLIVEAIHFSAIHPRGAAYAPP